eukprot:TRINITY_DN13893_c0_g1_i1.p1 TRINITY_DN13893_c0_g1~~TRINITY_DN13893_c0_g1_i1.p1  ORF type:complete len:288 (+),score=47.88 TRINITY_DN13893_c0_g1_i1:181-1044(+)
MVNVEDVLTNCLSNCVAEWFDKSLSHPFLSLHAISVPDTIKPIPKRWVEDVEVDELLCEEDDVLGEGPQTSWSHSETRRRLIESLQRLDLNENQVGSSNLTKMSKNELATEKRRVKQELKRYDSDFRKQFHRLPTHMEKEPMRPLYVYYRRLKTMISQADPGRAGRRASGSGAGSDDEGPGLKLGPRAPLHTIPDGDEPMSGAPSEKSHRPHQVSALEARIEMLQNEKSAVRAKLQAFQERFVAEKSRKIRFHKDILPIEREYRTYKTLKEDIAKAEAQLRDLKEGR